MANDFLLLTGASSDIGLALMQRLLTAQNDLRIVAHAHSGAERMEALQDQFGDRVQAIQCDLSDSTLVAEMAERIEADYGAPKMVVHLPALRLTHERFTKFDWSRFETDMAIQLRSAVILLQKFLPKMAKTPHARVVFVLSSVVHGMPPKFMSAYTVVKYAQLGLMRALAAEYAASTVRINAISPSMVDTQFLKEITEVAVQMSAAANPQGRNATPGDLLGALEFLLSEGAEYITGVDIPVAAGTVC